MLRFTGDQRYKTAGTELVIINVSGLVIPAERMTESGC